MVTVLLSPEAQDELDELPKSVRARVHHLLERLERWPDVSGAKPLRANLAGFYRLRTGDYRIQFRVAGKAIVVERIGHRDGFYEG